jgi:tetratricopeptide (TPR) repeat protein
LAGSSYFDAGEFDAAAREFQEAFELSGRPEMLLNLVNAHHKAGRLDEAIQGLTVLLERYPKTSLRPQAEEKLAALQAERDARSAPSEPSSAPPPKAPAPAPAPEEPVDTSRESSGNGPQIGTATWVVGGSAIAIGAAALGTGLVAHKKYSDCEDGSCTQSEIDSGKTLALVSTITTFAAVGAAGAAVTMYVLRVGVDEPRLTLAPWLSPTSSGLTASAQF